jgi:hypothetical protein
METLYHSLISDTELINQQFMGAIFDLASPEGPVLIYVSADYKMTSSHNSRTAFLHDEPGVLKELCGRIDDGDDPCVAQVEGGCLFGTQLQSDSAHLGYFFVLMPGYSSEVIQTNMDMAELILSQAQLICRLIEKNNKLHHSQLVHLSRRSAVLSSNAAEVLS